MSNSKTSIRQHSLTQAGSSMVEQRPFKAFVEGSSPSQPTTLKSMKMFEFLSLIFIAWIDVLVIKFSEEQSVKIIFATLLMAVASVLTQKAEELVS